jgi:Flp pilus assembly protein TadB
MLIVILAFVVVMREGRTKYEKRQDFFKQPFARSSTQEQQRNNSYASFSSRWDQQNNQQGRSAPRKIQRNAMIFVISLAVVAIAISIYTESLVGLFIIFTLPMMIGFLRTRSEERERRRTSADRGDS